MRVVFSKDFIITVILVSIGMAYGIIAHASSSGGRLLLIEKGSTQVQDFSIIGKVRIDEEGDVQITINEVLASGGARVDQPVLSIVGVSPDPDSNIYKFTITNSGAPVINFEWASRGAYRCVGIGTLPRWSDRVGLPAYKDFLGSGQLSLAQVSTSDLGPCNSYTAGIHCSNGSVSKQSQLLNIRVEQAGQC